jgi:hypothetical protein
LRIAAQLPQFVGTIVTRVRRHHPPVRALRFQPCQQRGNVVADRLTLLALGHCETGKTARGTEHRDREEYPDHVPTSIT